MIIVKGSSILLESCHKNMQAIFTILVSILANIVLYLESILMGSTYNLAFASPNDGDSNDNSLGESSRKRKADHEADENAESKRPKADHLADAEENPIMENSDSKNSEQESDEKKQNPNEKSQDSEQNSDEERQDSEQNSDKVMDEEREDSDEVMDEENQDSDEDMDEDDWEPGEINSSTNPLDANTTINNDLDLVDRAKLNDSQALEELQRAYPSFFDRWSGNNTTEESLNNLEEYLNGESFCEGGLVPDSGSEPEENFSESDSASDNSSDNNSPSGENNPSENNNPSEDNNPSENNPSGENNPSEENSSQSEQPNKSKPSKKNDSDDPNDKPGEGSGGIGGGSPDNPTSSGPSGDNNNYSIGDQILGGLFAIFYAIGQLSESLPEGWLIFFFS